MSASAKSRTFIACWLCAVPGFIAAQVYPDNFRLNGCDYTYNGFSLFPGDSVRSKSHTYQLIFEDDFDGDTLNTANWTTYYPWLGRTLQNNYSGTGWEREFYTDENVSVNGGLLHLKTIIDPGYRIPGPDTPLANVFFKYTSGMICSRQQFSEGKFEARCKIPFIDGTWPAFWAAGGCAQEIDGFEFLNSDAASDADTDSGNMIMSYHKQNDCADKTKGQCDNSFARTLNLDLSTDFHVFSFEWNENRITWKLDGATVREVDRIWQILPPFPSGPLFGYANPVTDDAGLVPFQNYTVFNTFPTKDNGMNFVLNTAVAYDRGDYPKEFLIDYVKIYTTADSAFIPQKEPASADFISIYPNPSAGKFRIEQPDKQNPITQIMICDELGKNILEMSVANELSVSMDFSQMPKGIYFAKIVCKNAVFMKKFVCNY